MVHDASQTLAARRRRRKQQAAAVAARMGTKPPIGTFGGADDGRRVPQTGTATSSTVGTLTRGSRALGTPPPGVDLTAANRRKKDPAAQYRRLIRQRMGITNVNQATPEQIEQLRRQGWLPGERTRLLATQARNMRRSGRTRASRSS